MNLNKLPFFTAVTGRLTWLSERHQLLASNLANADTPGYRPTDLKPVGFAELVQKAVASLRMKRTDGAHMSGAEGSDRAPFRIQRDKDVFEISPAGNAVVLEEQMLKAADNAMQHQLVTNLYSKQINLIRIAIGRGR
jgi:flagellar basal-body rod protein FlgB